MKNQFTKTLFTRLPAILLLPMALVLLAAQSALAANDYLGSSLAPGTYDLSNANWNATSETGTPLVAFVPGDAMIIGVNAADFSGSYTINLDGYNGSTGGTSMGGGAITIGGNNSTITFSGTFNTHFTVTTTLTVASGSTMIWTDTGNNNGFNNNGETVNLAGAGTINFKDTLAANIGAKVMTENMSAGGIVQLNQTAISNFGGSAGGGFTLQAGALQFGSASAMADAFIDFTNGNLVTINGGSIDNTSGSAGTINLGGNLNKTLIPTSSLGSYSIGGNFTFIGSSSLSLSNTPVALTGSRTITVNANTLTMGGVVSGSTFGITKAGNGTLMLSGVNTYNGATTVSAGELITTTASTGAGSYSVSDGATLDVQVPTAGQQLSMSSLTLGTSTGGTLQVDTKSTGSPSAAPVKIGGALTGNGTLTIILSGTALTTGTYPLISYGSENESFSGATLVTSPRVSATLSDNGTGLISVTINSVDPSIEWLGGASGVWDINDAANTIWQGISSHNSDYYEQAIAGNDSVTFDDNLTGTPTVNESTTLSPTAIIVSNTVAVPTYTFSGSGEISGTTGLTKQNAGSLILQASGGDNFSGGITIANGGGSVTLDDQNSALTGATSIGTSATLQIGNGDAYGSLPSTSAVMDNGTLTFDRSDTALTVGAVISGSGVVNQNGSGTVTLNAAPSAYSGATTINAGILKFNASSGGNGCVEGPITVNASGELDLNANDALGYNDTTLLTVSGVVKKLSSQSETLGRPILLSGGTLSTTTSGTSQFNFFNNYITTALGTANFINGPGKFDLRTVGCYITNQASSTLTISCVVDSYGSSLGALFKAGPGTLILSGANTFTNGALLNGGIVQADSAETPGTSGPLGELGTPGKGTISFGGGTLQYSSANQYDYSSRFVTTAGQAYSIDTHGQNVTYGTALTSSGGTLTKLGSGTLTLSGANTYAGATVVSGGDLVTTTASTGDGSFTVTNSSELEIQPTALGAQLAMSSLTLGNSGSDASTLVIDNGSLANPTAAPINISGALTSAGTITVQINGTGLTAGTFPLISYTSENQLFNAADGVTLVIGPRVNATLSDNGSGLISVTISSIDPSIEWLGTGSGVWDINNSGNLTWQGSVSHTSDYYEQVASGNDSVLFDDNNTGTPNVNLSTTVSPTFLTVTNTVVPAYTFSGSGSISGAATLIKEGLGSLTLQENGDSFSGGIGASNGTVVLDQSTASTSGGTIIANGATVQLGNNDANGVLPSGTLIDNGALTFNRNDTALAMGAISGTGAVANNGSGTVTLKTISTYSGGTTANNGTLVVTNGAGGSTPLGGGNVSVNPGATLVGANADTFGYEPNTAPANISILGGTLTDLGSSSYRITMPSLTLMGGTLSSAAGNSGSTGNYSLLGNGTACTVTTLPTNVTATINAAQISFQAPTTFNVAAGSVTGGANPGVDLFISSAIVPNGVQPVIKTGAGVLALDATNSFGGSVTVNQGTLQLGSPNDTATIASPAGSGGIVLNNSSILNMASSQQLTVSNISGSAGSVVVNGGTLLLPTANTFSGSFTLNSGTIRANNAGAFNNNPITETAVNTTIYHASAGTYGGAYNIIGYGVTESDGASHLGAIRFASAGANLSSGATVTLMGNAGITARGTGATGTTIASQITDNNGGPYTLRLGRVGTETGSSEGTLILDNTGTANNWHGNTTNEDGVLQMGAVAQIPSGTGYGNFVMSTPGAAYATSGFITNTVFDLHGFSQTVNGLSSDPNVLSSDLSLLIITNISSTPVTLTVGAGNATASYGGTIGNGSGSLGLTKTGAGTETLSGVNTYNGNTTISAGSLALSGSGSIANSPDISVAGSATFDVSALSSTFALGSSQTLGNSTVGATINGASSTGSGTVSLNYDGVTPSFTVANGVMTLSPGTVIAINNTSVTPLAVGTYAVITNSAAGSVAGSVSTTPFMVTGSGIASGTTNSLEINNGALDLVVTSLAKPSVFTGISVSGTMLTINATNGADGGQFTLLETTNLQLPINQWTPVFTNNFDANGNLVNFSTNVVVPNTPQEFYLLLMP